MYSPDGEVNPAVSGLWFWCAGPSRGSGQPGGQVVAERTGCREIPLMSSQSHGLHRRRRPTRGPSAAVGGTCGGLYATCARSRWA